MQTNVCFHLYDITVLKQLLSLRKSHSMSWPGIGPTLAPDTAPTSISGTGSKLTPYNVSTSTTHRSRDIATTTTTRAHTTTTRAHTTTTRAHTTTTRAHSTTTQAHTTTTRAHTTTTRAHTTTTRAHSTTTQAHTTTTRAHTTTTRVKTQLHPQLQLLLNRA